MISPSHVGPMNVDVCHSFVDVVDGDGYSDAAGVFAIIVACLPFLVLASLPFRRKITDDNQHQKPSDEEGLLN